MNACLNKSAGSRAVAALTKMASLGEPLLVMLQPSELASKPHLDKRTPEVNMTATITPQK